LNPASEPADCELMRALATWSMRRALLVVLSVLAAAAVLPVASARADGSVCSSRLGAASVGAPGRLDAWRAEVRARTAVFERLPRKGKRPSRWLAPKDASWLLVLTRPRVAIARCWLRLRLRWRPNHAAGWVNAAKLFVERTPWRIDVSRRRRALTLVRAGERVRAIRAVVGKPSTPTPGGLFAVVRAVRWRPDDFLGSWVLALTGHSDVLRRYDGGNGTIGIHGRGGGSLLDPLGSARSHGCIRLSNHAIDWLVHRIGGSRLPGTPVTIR
jgi:lipoprotein-anchoring transpeptidase ErfK/SrfK